MMRVFLLRKLSVDFWHFWVFVFCHRVWLKKKQKIFINSFFEVLRLFTCSEHFSKHFVCSGHNTQNVAQSQSKRNYHWSLKVHFLVIKGKMVHIKQIAFEHFCNNGKPLALGVFLTQKAFCWFQAFPGFRFLPKSIFQNLEST